MKVRVILPVTIRKRFSLLRTIEGINFGLVRMYETPYRFFREIFTSDLVISYTDKLLVFRWVQIVLLLQPICFYFAMRDFMTSLSEDNQADITEAFNSTSRYLDALLNIDNPYFEGMVTEFIHLSCN